ncbi:TetR/AcrR family transcriptional regulator [Mycolicibacterium sp. P1-18]|uniref:TetR/AcrR family transcriptional regulator n=1 Tax=Mycolicibacterium sp. P1-18 TaxID=2024615 RepID=UPI001F5BA5B9|nr:TetR/AcrR family transcriptional regulator [Mycolicibacterium sp. P1-18]
MARSDSKERMVSAARRLFREHGYHGTSLSDVVSESAAPRGSLYFNFPGGKEELATEVALLHASDAIAHVNRVAGATATAAELIEAFMQRFRDDVVAADFREGCAVAPIVVDSASSSTRLGDVVKRTFADVVAVLAARLVDKGLGEASARAVAVSAVTTMEGALILSRALRTTEPFDVAIVDLVRSVDAAQTNG